MAQSHQKRRRRHRSTWERRRRTLLAAVIAIGSIVAGAWVLERSTTESRQPVVSGSESGGEPIEASVPTSADRPIYKHSVILGGAWDHRELAGAIERDSVVAQHYRDLDPATMRTETLRADRLAFVSYRMGDRIYWTKHRVRISAGETILTNGDTAIRARCGNGISLEPMLPTSDEEPDPAELDALLGDDPVLASRWRRGSRSKVNSTYLGVREGQQGTPGGTSNSRCAPCAAAPFAARSLPSNVRQR